MQELSHIEVNKASATAETEHGLFVDRYIQTHINTLQTTAPLQSDSASRHFS